MGMRDTENTNTHAALYDTSFMLHELEDVFALEPDSSTCASEVLASGYSEYSDLPHLKLVHETMGYRDGIIGGKEKNVQTGFDQGYELGAILGLRVGMILGLLEGMVQGIKSYDEQQEAGERKQVQPELVKEKAEIASRVVALWQAAKNELALKNIFDAEIWEEYSLGCYKVLLDHFNGRISYDGDKCDGVHEGVYETNKSLDEITKAHPLVGRWQKLVENEVQKWHLNLKIFDQDSQFMDKIINSEFSRERVRNSSGKTYGISSTSSNVNEIPRNSTAHLNW